MKQLQNRVCRLLISAIVLLPLLCQAQNTENPRGIYKLTSIIGKQGETKAPFDQYKICTDSVTLMLSVSGNRFNLGNTDHIIFNYTGEEPDPVNAHATRIYDSNAERFTLKWWSTTPGHMFFPENDWCIEKYESGQYSDSGRRLFNALTSKGETDKANPLIGTWRILGMMDELRDVKPTLKKMQQDYSERPLRRHYYVILTKENLIHTGQSSISNVSFLGKNSMKVGNQVMKIKWLSKDVVALEVKQDWRTDYEIWQRDTDSVPVLTRIAGVYR